MTAKQILDTVDSKLEAAKSDFGYRSRVPLPEGMAVGDDLPQQASVLVALEEHAIKRYPVGAKRSRRR